MRNAAEANKYKDASYYADIQNEVYKHRAIKSGHRFSVKNVKRSITIQSPWKWEDLTKVSKHLYVYIYIRFEPVYA